MCDLMPGKEQLGSEEVQDRLNTWMDAWRNTLGPAAEELSSRLLGALF